MKTGMCAFCEYYQGRLAEDKRADNRLISSRYCKAFPGGIPRAILDGEVKHDKPFVGDNGYRFKQIGSR